MNKDEINEATGGYYDPGYEGLEKGGLKTVLAGIGIVSAIKWLEKRGDSVHDDRNKEELKKIKKQMKGYKFSKAELEKKNKQGMKLKDILGKVWMGDKIK
jgi:hypothetical protein